MRYALLVALVACTSSSSGPDLDDRDPRCVTACTPAMPEIAGTGAVCSVASQDACLDTCEARIADTKTACANCLVERGCLNPSGDCRAGGDDIGDQCTATTCTTFGPKGMCDYPRDNRTGYEQCRRQVDPEHEVACKAGFRPATDCASVCN